MGVVLLPNSGYVDGSSHRSTESIQNHSKSRSGDRKRLRSSGGEARPRSRHEDVSPDHASTCREEDGEFQESGYMQKNANSCSGHEDNLAKGKARENEVEKAREKGKVRDSEKEKAKRREDKEREK